MKQKSFILVVDDDPTLRELVTLGLQNLGYEVAMAEDGASALKLMSTRTPDAVVSDLMMPGMDGIDLCMEIRRRPQLLRVPVVILSAKNYESDKVSARNAGADAFLLKPVKIDALGDTLNRLVADQVRVSFWGVRGTLPCPGPSSVRYGGNTSCVEVEFPRGEHFILDAGSGIRSLGAHLMKRGGRRAGAILITHPHWDHINALPFFAPLYIPGNQFQICGPTQGSVTMRDLVAAQMDGRYFPITTREFGADVTYTDLKPGTFEIQGVEVATAQLMHPGSCLGYRIRYDGRTVAYITDQELSAPEFPDYSPAYVEQMARFLDGVDLLITDTTYSDAEYPRCVRWGHSSVSQVADLAHRAGVKRVALVHHDPSQDDAQIDAKLESCGSVLAGWGSTVTPIAPAEGDTIRV